MIRSDFHMHTSYADGKCSVCEMAEAAIAGGFDTIGFSEHAYVPFDPDYSMSPVASEKYRHEVLCAGKKYGGKIKILCGAEMDFDSEDDPALYEYIIGSVHYIKVGGKVYSVDATPEETLKCVREGFGGDFDGYAEAYFEKVARICEKTGANIIGHFDLITKFERFGASPKLESGRALHAWQSALRALAGKAALEINTGAMSCSYRDMPYPSKAILNEWKKLGGAVVITSDAHFAPNIGYAFDAAEALARTCGFDTAGFTSKNGVFYRQF